MAKLKAYSVSAFLYELKYLEKLGCNTVSTIEYTGSVLKITYFIQLGGFNIVTDRVEEWLNFNTLSVLAKKEFERKFENDLQPYNEATIKEFVETYG